MIKLIKHILIGILVVIIVIALVFFIVRRIDDSNRVLNMSNAIKDLLNDEGKSEFFDEKDYWYIEYAKKENVNYYDITDFVNNYFDIINKSIMEKNLILITKNMFIMSINRKIKIIF